MSEELVSRAVPTQCDALAIKFRSPVTMAQPPSMDPSVAYSSLSSAAYAESSSSSDGSYPFNSKVEGYDYDFIPPLDGRYECAICLLVLREPRQTPCGHRFCRDCILKWLRESQARCPVDNEPITDSCLFPDNFAKREIQNFTARCPNSKLGCNVIETVKKMPSHMQECPLAYMPCPNLCASVLTRRDLEEHMREHCEKRLVTCPDCGQEGQAADFQIEKHRKELCPKAEVPCMFNALGCSAQIQRFRLEEHVREALVPHLYMLCQGMITIMQRVGISQLAPEGAPPSTRELTATEVSGVMSSLVLPLQHLSLETCPSQTGPPLSLPPLSAQGVAKTPHSLDSSSAGRRAASPAGPSMPRSPSDPKYSTTSYPLPSTGAQEASGFSHTSAPSDFQGAKMPPQSSFASMPAFQSESSKATTVHQDERLVVHQQSLLELQAKMDNLERLLKPKLKQFDQQMNEMEGKVCNGQYYWRIRNYSRYQREAERGETTALHSHPFYTSACGYKLCIRANLNGVDSARGSHLSLFIHFMQGDNDDLLEWPFNGRIVLSVMDQNECCELRNHVAETLSSKPNLAAFQRPTTPRNHKGFGYMEFLPLSVLRKSSYIKNDTLIIKAHVLPNG